MNGGKTDEKDFKTGRSLMNIYEWKCKREKKCYKPIERNELRICWKNEDGGIGIIKMHFNIIF